MLNGEPAKTMGPSEMTENYDDRDEEEPNNCEFYSLPCKISKSPILIDDNDNYSPTTDEGREKKQETAEEESSIVSKPDLEDIIRLHAVLRNAPKAMITERLTFELIFDSGSTFTATGEESDFVTGTLKALDTPIHMTGISGGLNVTKEEQ